VQGIRHTETRYVVVSRGGAQRRVQVFDDVAIVIEVESIAPKAQLGR
jgi:hypothetical protein